MPDNKSTTQLPRKKPNVLWWLGGILGLLILYFCYQLFGPNPPIIVSHETTYITKPLRPDGLPDYERYVLGLYRDDVKPQDNAAVLLWQALWPGELDQKHHAALAAELGMEQLPHEDDSLVSVDSDTVRSQITLWFDELVKRSKEGRELNEVAAEEIEPEESPGSLVGSQLDFGVNSRHSFDSNLVFDLISDAQYRPWTSDQIPPLHEWAVSNQQALDLIVEATRKPRYYSPSPSLLDKPDGSNGNLTAILFVDIQSLRSAARSLLARAMWHLAENRFDLAWQDILAVHRLSRLIGQGHAFIEQLVAIAVDGMALSATSTLLDRRSLTAKQARQVQRDLAALSSFQSAATSIDELERLMALDMAIHFSSHPEDLALLDILETTKDPRIIALQYVSVDWNHVLATLNFWYDKTVAAASVPNPANRLKAIDQVEAELEQLANQKLTRSTWVAGMFSRSARSDVAAFHLLELFINSLPAMNNAQNRANNMLDLTRLAAALAIYRAEHGMYPEKLDALVPGILKKLPVDLYHAKPFIYKPTEDGYLLYSAGENGVDDGGSNEQMSIFGGQPLDESNDVEALKQQIPTGADDHSIRLPRPAFELPKLPLKSNPTDAPE